MNYDNSNREGRLAQGAAGVEELSVILDAVDATQLIERLQAYRWTGRKGYSQKSLWRAYLTSFILNLPSTNALIRYLQSNREVRLLCGFKELPHRTTFNRFIKRLENHQGLIEQCLSALTDQIAGELSGFGEQVAIDSTVVRAYSNPNRKVISDPDASWTAKNSARAKGTDGKEWSFGYKYHAIADARYNIPLIGYTTTASASDTKELPVLLDLARQAHGWFAPGYVIADKGYDSRANHDAVIKSNSIPVIAIRRPNKKSGPLQEGIYTDDGTPTCMGIKPMQYVRSDPKQGHLYRCPPGGCHLKTRKGVLYCKDSHWENVTDNPRLFGPLRRDSKEWKTLYRKRQSIERVFKSLKQSRRLESHCIMGLSAISLHATMSVLSFQASVLVRIQAGETDSMCWMVKKVA